MLPVVQVDCACRAVQGCLAVLPGAFHWSPQLQTPPGLSSCRELTAACLCLCVLFLACVWFGNVTCSHPRAAFLSGLPSPVGLSRGSLAIPDGCSSLVLLVMCGVAWALPQPLPSAGNFLFLEATCKGSTSAHALGGCSPCRQGRHGTQGFLGDGGGLRQNLGSQSLLALNVTRERVQLRQAQA